MTSFRYCRRAACSAIALVLAACATRRPETMVLLTPTSSVPVWRLEAGDVIRTRIYREPDLGGETVVTGGGQAYFPGLGRVPVAGFSLDSLQLELAARYSRLIVDVALDATIQRDVVIYGQVRTAGVYLADPGTTVLGLMARAGGASGPGRSPIMTLVKGDGRQYRLRGESRLSTLEIVHGDAIYVQDDTFIGRNASNLSAFSVLASLTVSLITIFVVVSR